MVLRSTKKGKRGGQSAKGGKMLDPKYSSEKGEKKGGSRFTTNIKGGRALRSGVWGKTKGPVSWISCGRAWRKKEETDFPPSGRRKKNERKKERPMSSGCSSGGESLFQFYVGRKEKDGGRFFSIGKRED